VEASRDCRPDIAGRRFGGRGMRTLPSRLTARHARELPMADDAQVRWQAPTMGPERGVLLVYIVFLACAVER
jgi:hypothetical protein